MGPTARKRRRKKAKKTKKKQPKEKTTLQTIAHVAYHSNAFNPDTQQIAQYFELSKCSEGHLWVESRIWEINGQNRRKNKNRNKNNETHICALSRRSDLKNKIHDEYDSPLEATLSSIQKNEHKSSRHHNGKTAHQQHAINTKCKIRHRWPCQFLPQNTNGATQIHQNTRQSHPTQNYATI